MPKATDAIVNFLRAKRDKSEHSGPDLLNRFLQHGCNLEVQVNVHAADGEPVANTRSTFTDGIDKWFSFRIPKNACDEPHFRDFELPFPLDTYCVGIGSTGWDWVAKRSRWVGFDFDAIAGHAQGVGVTSDELDKVRSAAQALPYVEVRKSTGGAGLHLYILFEDDAAFDTQNHIEHAGLARALLGVMSHDAGFDFDAKLDACGGNMWLWHQKSAGTDGLSLIKAGELLLATELPTEWRKQVPARNSVAEAGIWDELTQPYPRIEFSRMHKWCIQELGRLCTTEFDEVHQNVKTHTVGLAKLNPEFETISAGTDLFGSPNCRMYPRLKGWRVVRWQSTQEHESWLNRDGEMSCDFQWTWELIARCYEAATTKTGYEFKDLRTASEACQADGNSIEVPPELHDRLTTVKHSKGRLFVQVPRHKEDAQPRGWNGSDSKRHWTYVIHRDTASPLSADRPQILITPDEQRVADESIATLQDAMDVYQRGAHLVRVAKDSPTPPGLVRQPGAARIELLPPPALREKLSSLAVYLKMTERGEQQIHIPQWLVAAVLARGDWPVPSIEMISAVPILRPDGSVISEPGYDPETGVFYLPDAEYPEVMDCELGLQLLSEVFHDFPFATPAHRAACIAAVLTPFGRQAIDGCTPLFVVDGNSPGVGKGLLIDAITAPFSNRSVARMSAPSADDEWRKRITAIALAAEPIVVIDNVAGVLGGPSLDAALTSTRWADRLLGVNETISVPLTTVWLTTGNNLRLSKDTSRRTAHIRLHSLLENPEERTDFLHPNLKAWLSENRPALAVAALSILKAYIDAGRPDQKLTPWGSFESWSNLIRGAVVWLGLPDPGGTRLALRDDEDTVLLDQILTGWQEADPEGVGMTAAQAVSLVSIASREDDGPHSTLRAAIESLPGRDLARELGSSLAKFKERVCKGRYFDGSTKNRNKVVVWKVIACEPHTQEAMSAKAA
jgi:hypothetical protein